MKILALLHNLIVSHLSSLKLEKLNKDLEEKIRKEVVAVSVWPTWMEGRREDAQIAIVHLIRKCCGREQ